MKRINWIFALLFGTMITACGPNNNDPKEQPTPTPAPAPTPVVPTSPLEIPKVSKIEVMIIEGHLHGTYGFHESADPVDQKHMKRLVKFVYDVQADGSLELAAGSSDKLCAVGGEGEHDPKINTDAERSKKVTAAYGIWIDYFDAEGNKVTSEVLENGHENRLQHFFTVDDVRPTFDGDKDEVAKRASSDKFITYIYCDTKPLSSRIKDNAPVIGTDNPIGHKGYVGFSVPRSECQLHITLSDLDGVGKKDNGSPRPATAVPAGAKTIFSISIPVTVYAHYEEFCEAESLDELSEEDKKYLTSISKAYGITIEEAFAALENRLNNTPKHSDSGYWF